MKWNNLINTGFAGCRALLSGRDEHRGRDVKIFAIAGDFENVGFSDGVDHWVVPINAHSELVSRAAAILRKIRAGEDPPAEVQRRKVVIDDDPPIRRRLDIHAEPQITRRMIINV